MGDSPVKPLHKRTVLARRLRRDATDAERALWFGSKIGCRAGSSDDSIRSGGVSPISRVGEKLVIELDGGQHGVRQSADEAPTAELAAHGYRILRFWIIDVVENFEGVLETVRQALETSPPHPALSTPRGGEGMNT